MKLSLAALATLVALPVAAQVAPATPRPDARTEMQAQAPAAQVEPKGATAAPKKAAPKKAKAAPSDPAKKAKKKKAKNKPAPKTAQA